MRAGHLPLLPGTWCNHTFLWRNRGATLAPWASSQGVPAARPWRFLHNAMAGSRSAATICAVLFPGISGRSGPTCEHAAGTASLNHPATGNLKCPALAPAMHTIRLISFSYGARHKKASRLQESGMRVGCCQRRASHLPRNPSPAEWPKPSAQRGPAPAGLRVSATW